VQIVLYPMYVVCGIAIYYSLMIALAATSVWLGRNQTLFDFWFYITTSPAIRWKSIRARGVHRCGGCSRSPFPCWWW